MSEGKTTFGKITRFTAVNVRITRRHRKCTLSHTSLSKFYVVCAFCKTVMPYVLESFIKFMHDRKFATLSQV
jgi:hypothetical protein